MINLTWETINDLNEKFQLINYSKHSSALTFLSWKFYGVDIEYHYEKVNNTPVVFLFGKFNELSSLKKDSPIFKEMIEKEQRFIFMPFFHHDTGDIKLILQHAQKLLLANYPDKNAHIIEAVSNEFLAKANLSQDHYEILATWNSNFIYDLEKLKFLKGKQLQKRRNHLNYFINNFQTTTKITKIQKSDFAEILELTLNYQKNSESNKNLTLKNEYIFISELLNHWELFSTLSGVVLRCVNTNKLLGYTIGNSCKETYEILFEKGNLEFRGSFQYLLTQNLQLNNINLKYVDRQDDIDDPGIYYSKVHYYPIEIVVLNMIHCKQHKTNDCIDKLTD